MHTHTNTHHTHIYISKQYIYFTKMIKIIIYKQVPFKI